MVQSGSPAIISRQWSRKCCFGLAILTTERSADRDDVLITVDNVERAALICKIDCYKNLYVGRSRSYDRSKTHVAKLHPRFEGG